MKPLHIALVGPIAGEHIAQHLNLPASELPQGYTGAPLTGILIGELLRMGHQVTGITTDSELTLKDEAYTKSQGRFKIIICPARPRAWRNNGWRVGRALDAFYFERHRISQKIAEIHPDIIHAHWSYEFALAAIAQPYPHLITCHDSPIAVLRHTRSPYRAVRSLMANKVFRKGTHFTAVSDYLAKSLSTRIGSTPPVIPNPVSERALQLGRPRDITSRRNVAVVTNGWGRLKNTASALHGFSLWRSTEPAAELWLFGTDHGPGGKAQQWAEQHNLTEGVHFVGHLSHMALLEYLTNMDALLHPSLEESFGVVAAEAMALGLPVIAGAKSGAIPWVLGVGIDGTSACGSLVDVTDATSVSLGLNLVFNHNYHKTSKAAYNRAQTLYTPNSVAKSYIEMYKSIINK